MVYTYGERNHKGDQSNLLAPVKILLLSHPSCLPVSVCTDFRITGGTSVKFHIARFYERRLVQLFSVLVGIEVIIVDTLHKDRCTSVRSSPQRNMFGVKVAEKN